MKISNYLKSKISLKIIKFFLENPSSIDTSRGIAVWINENIRNTEKTLKELVKANILIYHSEGAASAYGCTTDNNIVSKLKTGLEKLKIKK